MSNWIEGKVIENKRWTTDLHSLFIEAKIQPFIAGQFGRIALDIEGEQVARPYSFVNSPDDPILEVYFVKVPQGPLTPKLVDLKPGDSIYVSERTAGLFTLKEVPNSDILWCFATGTALGAFISILRTEEAWARFGQVVLVHAVRKKEELTHQDWIMHFQEEHPNNFRYIPFVSREEAEGALSGRVPQAIEDGRLEAKAGLALSPLTSQIMICGNPNMVKDTMAVLQAREFKKNLRRDPGHITIENYWKD